uniref:Uncharacterized protein n=1 Tax=Ciona intestinalis TaxID=7719 RepID=H2XTL7_CIOIN
MQQRRIGGSSSKKIETHLLSALHKVDYMLWDIINKFAAKNLV